MSPTLPAVPGRHVSFMSCLSELESVAEEWDSLAMASRDPFLTVAWLSAWWEAYDGAMATLTVRGSDGRLVAGLPCRRISRTTWGSPTNAESGSWGVLAADESTRRQVWRTLAEVGPRRLRLQCLLDRENVEAARDELEAAGYRTVTTSGTRSPYLDLPATYEELLASVSHNLRSQVNRRRRGLEKHGVLRLRDVRGGDELQDALRTVLWLEGSGWKTRAGTSILSDPATEKLYCTFARAAAGAGWLRLYILEVDGQPIAADFGCSFNGVGYLLKTGFDVEFQRYSPGLVLRAEVLKASIEEGLSGYDFLGGPDSYKLRWASTIRPRFGLRAYRDAPLSAEWLYWRHARPLLRWVAWRTVRRSSPLGGHWPSLPKVTADAAGRTPARGEVGAASPLVVPVSRG